VTCGLLGAAPAARAAISDRPTVVVVAVPGLRWSDVEAMPAVRALAAQSSVGELSVKTAHLPTSCGAGLLAVSAGNRTTVPTSSCAIDMSSWPALAHANSTTRYDATIGGLGSTLQADGVRTVAVTAAAQPMLANRQGAVDVVAPTLSAALTTGGVIAVLDQQLYDVPPVRRPAAAAAVDAHIAAIQRALPPGTVLMVAGISDLAGGPAQLHAIVIHGPGWAHTQLRSSAAGRAPFVQLIDVAPTILAAAGIPEPSFMVGRVMQPSGSSVPSLSRYVDDDRHARDQRTLGQRVFLVLGLAAILMMALAAAPVPAGQRLAGWLARVIAPVPALVFLANGLPWWRWPQPVYGGIVLVAALVLAGATTLAARRSLTAALLVVPVLSFVVLAIDQLTGARLQLSAPLGDSPLIAGRFAGMGNLDFAVFATSALLIAGVVGGRLARGPAVLSAGAIAVVALVVDGAPQLGNDIGGVLALLPAAIVVVALVAQVRLTAARVVAVVLITVVVAVGIALADYSRPASHQTHVGRFVGQVLHGGAGTEVRRKLDSAVGSVGLTVGTFVVAVTILAGIIAHQRVRRALATSLGVTVLAVIGAALNDSGITIAAVAAIVAVGAIYGAGLTGAPAAATTEQIFAVTTGNRPTRRETGGEDEDL
jgi:hypothetical protein